MTSDAWENMGERVARYRKLNGMTGDELAELAGNGVTRAVIANIETGRKRDMTVSQLIAISVALQVPPVSILFDIRAPKDGSGVYLRQSQTGNTEFTVSEAITWFGGVERAWNPAWPAARQEVRNIMMELQSLSQHENEYAGRQIQAAQYQQMKDRADAGLELDEPWTSSDDELLAFFIEARDHAAHQVLLTVERLAKLGVNVDSSAIRGRENVGGKVEIYLEGIGFRFRMLDSESAVLATSEAYESYEDALEGVKKLQQSIGANRGLPVEFIEDPNGGIGETVWYGEVEPIDVWDNVPRPEHDTHKTNQ